MNIKIISPGSVMYRKEGGIFPRLLRYAPLTLSTLASLVPDELKASVELNDEIAKKIKNIVDDKAKFVDWSERNDVKATLKVELIVLLDENGYPPVTHDEAYKEVLEQAENFKKHR